MDTHFVFYYRQIIRKDLIDLKVYAIDVDEADELQDGRIKVWIHVANPTRYVEPGSSLGRYLVEIQLYISKSLPVCFVFIYFMACKEAMRGGTSVFLPTATYPMFPENLAMRGMSLRQGDICNAVSVSIVLPVDECSVVNSVIKPTYTLTYESASELLHLNLEEEGELRILSEAAKLRLNWCRLQVL
ncbi:hypothetical protein RIF29_25631 [Crotalaria pallida]|uniref:RNB domain-containing protein n=1 Tax=Crotalaria pallida TaxID=3830 RepID=A0AAN9I4D6_CROPI